MSPISLDQHHRYKLQRQSLIVESTWWRDLGVAFAYHVDGEPRWVVMIKPIGPPSTARKTDAQIFNMHTAHHSRFRAKPRLTAILSGELNWIEFKKP